MRRFFLTCLLSGASVAVFAQKPVTKPGNVPVATNRGISRNDSIQYILGAYIGQWIKANGFLVTNASLFSKGMNDVLTNQPGIIPDSVIGTAMAAYQKITQKERALREEQQLFSGLKDKQGVGAFPNGVRYLILKAGRGLRPAAKDSVLVHLVAKLPDGTVVEDTYRMQQPFNAIPDSFFSALSEALQMMPEGSKWQIYFPAALAYGEKGTANIPPNSALIIDLELVQVKYKR
jgi:FKBP-type peptidyl-prolyl cis-trans isomerase FklB